MIETQSPEEAGKRGRRWGLATGAAVVAIASITLLVTMTIGNDQPEPEIPDFSQNETLVGEALTAAYHSGDNDLFLSLFAADAELEFSGAPGLFFGDTITLDRYREFLDNWSQPMNESWEWDACQRTGSAAGSSVVCEVEMTNDWFALMRQQPDRGWVIVQIDDGTITHWDHRGLRSPNDVTVSRFEDWTRQNHPSQAVHMWQSDRSVFPIFSEESAKLHLELGEAYFQEIFS